MDDEPAVRDVLTCLLEQLDLDVTSCGDADEAWEQMQCHPPDMLLTDWMLPGTSGLELVRRIRRTSNLAGLYVIVLTGRATHTDLVKGLEAGADDFLAKPFDQAELRLRVRAGERMLYLRRQLVEQNARLGASNREMSAELLAAGRLQRAIIPAGHAHLPGFDGEWAFHPHGQASGDMYGGFSLDERHAGVFMVDVSGHGMAAAML